MRLSFKDSPFYTIVEPLTPVFECKGRQFHTLYLFSRVVDNNNAVREVSRDQLDAKINFRTDIVERLNGDPSIKAMIYCASEPISPFSQVDIVFPHPIEIRVNLDEVKANLRGLKGKPGSTRPADITGFLRKRAGYENSLNVTYALTNKVRDPLH